jgi:hypothetical protein
MNGENRVYKKEYRPIDGSMIMEVVSSLPEAQFESRKPGSHWEYVFSWDDVSCRISSFEPSQTGARHFWLDLNNQDILIAQGHSHLETQIGEATVLWLKYRNLSQIYEQFDFIDREKRHLAALREKLFAHQLELQSAILHESRPSQSDAILRFENADRCCQCKSWVKGYKIHFIWDACTLFEFYTEDSIQVAPAIVQWVLHGAMPSAMNRQFPWFETKRLSEYYEAGRGVEGEFLDSWDDIEAFFLDFKFPQAKNALKFIANLRHKGFDRTLRAGQSLTVFIVSRSRRHGLQPHQASIAFGFTEFTTQILTGWAKPEAEFDGFEVNPEIEQRLRTLEAIPIN